MNNSIQSLLVELFDLFSFGFSFSINKRYRISTLPGAIFSELIFAVLILLFFLLGEDFLYSKNPKTSTSSYQKPKFNMINLTEDYSTIVISFTRQEDQIGFPPLVNITGGFLFGLLTNQNGTFNTEFNVTEKKIEGISIVECSEEFKTKYNFMPGNYYCLNLSEVPQLFGDDTQNEYDFYKFTIAGCKRSVSYIRNISCVPLEDLDLYFKQYYYLSYFKIFYPTHFYDPNDYDNPSKIVYKETMFPFDHNLQRTDSLYFRETIVEEDDGWLFENKKNTSYWTVEERDYFYNYRTNEDIRTTEASSILYTMYIYQSKNVVYHTRNYMKLTELLSYIFCYIRIIITVVALFFNIFVNPIVLKLALIKMFFDEGNMKTSNLDIVRSVNFQATKTTSVPTTLFQKVNDSQISQNRSNQVMFQIKNNINNENNRLSINGTLLNANIKKINSNKDSNISKTGYVFYKLKSFFTSKTSKEKKHFYLADKILSENYDLERYTEMIYDIQIMKQCLYPPECLYIANNHKKYNINNIDESEKMFGMNMCHYQDKCEMKETLNKLKVNYPNMMKGKEYFSSLAKDYKK